MWFFADYIKQLCVSTVECTCTPVIIKQRLFELHTSHPTMSYTCTCCYQHIKLTLFALRNFEYSISIVFFCEDNAPSNSATFFCSVWKAAKRCCLTSRALWALNSALRSWSWAIWALSSAFSIWAFNSSTWIETHCK